jgi:hypothetical protein
MVVVKMKTERTENTEMQSEYYKGINMTKFIRNGKYQFSNCLILFFNSLELVITI